MNELYDNIKITFIRGGTASVGKNTENANWCAYNKINEENKFYLPTSGRGELFINGAHYSMQRGRLFLIGAGEYRSYYTAPKDALYKRLVHFYASADGLNIKEAFDLPDFVPLTDDEYNQVLNLFSKITINDSASPENIYELFENKSKVYNILSYYIELARKKELHYVSNRGTDSQICFQLMEYLKNTFPMQIDTAKLAKNMSMNEKYFIRYFKVHFNATPHNLMQKLRISTAFGNVLFTQKSISEISSECGFENIQAFSAYFKQIFNLSPLKFRKNYISSFFS